MSDSEIVDKMAASWRSIDQLCTSFTEREWDTPTDCPGWTVKDVLAHLSGTEAMLLGRGRPDHRPPNAGTLRNAMAERNEVEVDYRRPWTGAQVLDEFREVTAQRIAMLRSYGEDDFSRESWTPTGRGAYRDLLRIRIFDCWVHQQDIRRAVGIPGGFDGPIAADALAVIAQAMPYVVGKKVAPPDGTSVVCEITGPTAAMLAIGVEGRRARPLLEVPANPTVRLTMDVETYACLACGRWEPQHTLTTGRVHISGDQALGRTVVAQLNFVM